MVVATTEETAVKRYCKTALLLPWDTVAVGYRKPRPMRAPLHGNGNGIMKSAAVPPKIATLKPQEKQSCHFYDVYAGAPWKNVTLNANVRPSSAPALRSRPASASRADMHAALQRGKLVSESWAKALSAPSSRPDSASRKRPGSAPSRRPEAVAEGKPSSDVGGSAPSMPTVSWPCWGPALRSGTCSLQGADVRSDSPLRIHRSPWPNGAGWLLSASPPRAVARGAGRPTRGMVGADITNLAARQTASKALSERIAKKKNREPEKRSGTGERKVSSARRRVPLTSRKSAGAGTRAEDDTDENEEMSPQARWRCRLLEDPWSVEPTELATVVRAELGLARRSLHRGVKDDFAGDGAEGGSRHRSAATGNEAAEDMCTAPVSQHQLTLPVKQRCTGMPQVGPAQEQSEASGPPPMQDARAVATSDSEPLGRSFRKGPSSQRGNAGLSKMGSKMLNAAALPSSGPQARSQQQDCVAASSSSDEVGIAAFRARAVTTFRRLSTAEREEISRGNLVPALHLLGYWYPDQELVHDILENGMDGKSNLDVDDFLDFVGKYEQRKLNIAKQNFRTADVEGVGAIGLSDLSTLLSHQGLVVPISSALEDLVREAFRGTSLGEDRFKFGMVPLEAFLGIQQIITSRAGFTRGEADDLQSAFSRHDSDDDGRISVDEAVNALSWTGMQVDAADVGTLVQQVDPNGSGFIGISEFLIVAQKYRQKEIRQILESFTSTWYVEPESGTIGLDEVRGVFQSLGYVNVSADLISEMMRGCDLHGKAHLSFEEVYKVLLKMRENEGFPCAEMDAIKKLFKEYASERAHCIGLWEAARVIQYLGYPVSLEDVRGDSEGLDLHQRGELDYREFLKLAAKYHERELRSAQNVFLAQGIACNEKVPVCQLQKMLQSVGYSPSPEQMCAFEQKVSAGVDNKQLSLNELMRAAAEYRAEHRSRMQSSLLFTEAEISALSARFRKHDLKRAGTVLSNDVGKMLGELCRLPPFSGASRHSKCDGDALLKEVGLGEATRIDFEQFLQVARMHLDTIERHTFEKEHLAIRSTKFQSEEVQEFRGIFNAFDGKETGELSLKDFVRLVSSIIPTVEDAANVESELSAVIRSTTKSETSRLDFADFLGVMHRLQEMDWRSINSISARIAAKNASKT